MLNEFIKKNIFKFQYDNTLSKQSSEEKISTNRFKFQYDNTLSNYFHSFIIVVCKI